MPKAPPPSNKYYSFHYYSYRPRGEISRATYHKTTPLRYKKHTRLPSITSERKPVYHTPTRWEDAAALGLDGVKYLECGVKEARAIRELFLERNDQPAKEGKVALLKLCLMQFPQLFWWMSVSRAMARGGKMRHWGGESLSMMCLMDMIGCVNSLSDIRKLDRLPDRVIYESHWIFDLISPLYTTFTLQYPTLLQPPHVFNPTRQADLELLSILSENLFLAKQDPPMLVFLGSRALSEEKGVNKRREEVVGMLTGRLRVKQERYLDVGGIQEKEYKWFLELKGHSHFAQFLATPDPHDKPISPAHEASFLYTTSLAINKVANTMTAIEKHRLYGLSANPLGEGVNWWELDDDGYGL